MDLKKLSVGRKEIFDALLDIFLDKLSDHNFENIQKRQRDALSSTAVNLDGTCGEKVHKQMMDILKQEIYNY